MPAYFYAFTSRPFILISIRPVTAVGNGITISARVSVCSSSRIRLIRSIDQIDRILELHVTEPLGEQMALEVFTEFCDLQQSIGPQFKSFCPVNDRAKNGRNGGTLLIDAVA